MLIDLIGCLTISVLAVYGFLAAVNVLAEMVGIVFHKILLRKKMTEAYLAFYRRKSSYDKIGLKMEDVDRVLLTIASNASWLMTSEKFGRDSSLYNMYYDNLKKSVAEYEALFGEGDT